jgi:DNA-directed RNA polymerase subunit RPC12/RpoP
MRKSATVRVVHETKPKRPAVDSGEEFETKLREMFKGSVGKWCKANRDDKSQPDKETVGQVVDDLVAHWSSAIETTIEAATASYLSTFDDETDVIECPECEHEFDLPETHADGRKVKDKDEEQDVECPECKHEFSVELIEGDDEDDDDPDDGERKAG